MQRVAVIASAIACALCVPAYADTTHPLTFAHAHNDYEHPRPLLDALDYGFCSVEADIHLVGNQLLVAHDLTGVSPGRTLDSLYLVPLRERAIRNGSRIQAEADRFVLLIDIKTSAGPTWNRLNDDLKCFAPILTHYSGNTVTTGPITVILTGNCPRAQLAAQRDRLAALDGRLTDLDSTMSSSLMPLISDNWTQHFSWKGIGPIPAAELQKLRGLVSRAHAKGRMIRFWAAPETREAWRELRQAGVDLLSVDDLAGLRSTFAGAPAAR